MPSDNQNLSPFSQDTTTLDSPLASGNAMPPQPQTTSPLDMPSTEDSTVSFGQTSPIQPPQPQSLSQNPSVLNPMPANGNGGGATPPSGQGPQDTTVTSSHVPKKYGGKKVIATIFSVLFIVGAVAAGVFLVQQQQELREQASQGPGKIAIFKTMCSNIGQQDTCNGRDTSLSDYKIDFKVYQGETDSGSLVQTLTVTLSENNNGQGSTGNGSQGRTVGSELALGKYTVCEIPEAYNSSGSRVPLEVEPRPEASNGGSTGGTNQKEYKENCITVDLTPGEAELKYLDKRKTPAASPTPAATSTITPTHIPGATNTPTPKNTATPGPTLPPGITAQCNSVKAYDLQGNLLTQAQLSQLTAGSKVRFAVSGTTSSGSFDKARFTVNNVLIGESTNKNTSNEYYFDYEIPQSATTFNVKGEVHHSTLGWI